MTSKYYLTRKKWREANKEKFRGYIEKYKNKNREKYNKRRREMRNRTENRIKEREQLKRWRKENKKKINEMRRRWYNKHKEEIRKKQRIREKTKYHFGKPKKGYEYHHKSYEDYKDFEIKKKEEHLKEHGKRYI